MKNHYWLVNAKVWNKDHYDELTLSIDAPKDYINKQALDDCKKAVSIQKGCDSENVLITNVSYLGHMTAEEFNG